jgi:hypothetical protein
MILFRCPKCGERSADLEGHRCVPPPDRLAKARAVLDEASKAVGLPVEDERAREGLAGVRAELRRRAAEAPPAVKGFDRGKYQREYMRGWRARKRAKPTSSP